MADNAQRLLLQAIQAWDRSRLARLQRVHAGLEIQRGASTNFACARFELAAGARLCLEDGVVTERLARGVSFLIGEGAEVVVGRGTWLRTALAPVHLVAFAGARMWIGPDGLLNGCQLSAKRSVELGRRVFVGVGSRIFDSDQHDVDADRPERSEPVRVGDHSWIAADCTITRGVEIGAHCVLGARSLLMTSLPDHTLAYGVPAEARGLVGDRTHAG